MNAGQLAALIAAVFFAAGVCVASYALIKLARLTTETLRYVTGTRERADLLIERAVGPVIRRLFWLLAGAGLGISGYRRVTRVFRGFARPGPRRRPRRGHGLAGFARDVREGMDLYAERQRLNTERRHAPAGPTL